MRTDYNTFYYAFKDALATNRLDKSLIYSDELIEWLEERAFIDLYNEAWKSLQTRSYPSEIEKWVKETLHYLYGGVPVVDAAEKHIPDFLLKHGCPTTTKINGV